MLRRCAVVGLFVLSSVAIGSLGALGCGSTATGPGFGGKGSDGGAGPNGEDSDGGIVLGGGDGSIGNGGNCATGAGQFIYVITEDNNLYTFDPTQFPAASAFTLVGPVPCNPMGGGVNSMAVDRSATAWVNFADGTIYKMTTTAPITCTQTGFVAGQGGFTNALGMGFASDGPDSGTETLYVSDNAGPGGDCMATTPSAGCMGKGLGTIDLTTMTLTPIGAYTGPAAGYNAELTGSGDGRLFGFFTTSARPRTGRSTRRPAARARPRRRR